MRQKTINYKVGLRLLLCCWLLSLAVYGQSGRRAEPGVTVKPDSAADSTEAKGVEDVVRVRTEEVMVPVSVRSVDGKPVNGLTAERFLVYDNGVRQEIASFNRQRVPANIVLLLDASGSVFHQMRFIREAARQFVEGLLKEDRVCVMQFADRVELLQDWTSAEDPAELAKAIEWRYRPGQSTAFYDGLYLAAEEQLKKTEGRRIIILLTDGIDTAEKRRASQSD
ncbi:MAG TPA: VWA domain-containing protein, partial [Pyrinomonadaceae bacterium]|nr:VWA domain-containing protein [Pyrinomonadaceae bacterium]